MYSVVCMILEQPTKEIRKNLGRVRSAACEPILLKRMAYILRFNRSDLFFWTDLQAPKNFHKSAYYVQSAQLSMANIFVITAVSYSFRFKHTNALETFPK